MTDRSTLSGLVVALGVLCAGAIVAAFLVVGPASGSQTAVTRTARVAEGVVQSTVSGSGNLEALSQLNLGFETGGTVSQIHMHVGEQVAQGQLLAELDPQSAEVTLEQSKAALQSAEANLAKEEETGGEGSSGGSSGGANASAATVGDPSSGSSTGTGTQTGGNGKGAANNGSSGSDTSGSQSGSSGSGSSGSGSSGSSGSGSSGSGSSAAGNTTTTTSTATREANLASARAQVRSDALTVQSDQQALANTRLYAPESGTIVSLSGEVGEVVSGGGTTRTSGASSSGSSSSGSNGTSGSGGRSATGAASATGSSASSGSSGSSGSSFADLSDLSSMQLVVPLSESEVGSVKPGQIATVTVEALSGRKLAAHVSNVAILSTSNSGVVSYDVTFRLDQMDPGLKPGMSASAQVVVKQAEGINAPSTAISAGKVTVVRGGRHVSQRVATGLVGDSSTIILSGLKVGETVVLPSLSTSTSSSSGLGRAGVFSRAAGAGGFAGPGGLGGGAGPTLLRGGG